MNDARAGSTKKRQKDRKRAGGGGVRGLNPS